MDQPAALSPERDLAFAEAMAADLKAYLLGQELYWPLSQSRAGQGILPRGTLGGLLLRLHRLAALADRLSPEQRDRLAAARALSAEQIEAWRAQAEARALREMQARLRGWQLFAEECADNPRRYRDEYPTQAESRTVLALLLAADDLGRAAERTDLPDRLAQADSLLKTAVEPADFVWHPALRETFPEEDFWWLYVLPRLQPEP